MIEMKAALKKIQDRLQAVKKRMDLVHCDIEAQKAEEIDKRYKWIKRQG
jgi:hypothetical protein